MIDALKDLVLLIKDLPQYVVWILAGFFMYKLFIVGSVYGVARLAINKFFLWAMKPQEKIVKFEIDGICIRQDGVADSIIQVINNLKGSDAYLHRFHVNFLQDAIAEKFRNEGPPHCSKNAERKII